MQSQKNNGRGVFMSKRNKVIEEECFIFQQKMFD